MTIEDDVELSDFDLDGTEITPSLCLKVFPSTVGRAISKDDDTNRNFVEQLHNQHNSTPQIRRCFPGVYHAFGHNTVSILHPSHGFPFQCLPCWVTCRPKLSLTQN